MVKAATKVDLYPRIYLDDVNFGWLLEQAGINGLKGNFRLKKLHFKAERLNKISLKIFISTMKLAFRLAHEYSADML